MARIVVEATGNSFGLLVGQRGVVDDADPEIARGLELGVLIPVGPYARRRSASSSGGCGCRGT